MLSQRRALPAAFIAAALLLSACGGQGSSDSPRAADNGEPVTGGAATVLMLSDPRSLDPGALGNVASISAVLGNALYGTLLTDDPETGKIDYQMAEGFSTSDAGSTFTLKLRPGLAFSDGTPLDAAAVKFNWDRLKDRATASPHAQEASLVKSTQVVDATTLTVTLAQPAANFDQAVVISSLNWIGSPTALKAGRQAFDAKPVGAGPYVLKSWTRQGDIELVRNPGYWDKPRPYLDSLTLRAATDAGQRLNSVISGDADLAVDTNWQNFDKAEKADLVSDVIPKSGGLVLGLNNRRPPFNDPRAREAVAAAIDNEALNAAVYDGASDIVDTLFRKESPFYADKPLRSLDRDRAKQLFDELAAEGKPVAFSFSTFPTTEGRAMAESVQAQLATYDNVKVDVKLVDFADSPRLAATNDYDVLLAAAAFGDPEPTLFNALHGSSRRNVSGVDDRALNDALVAGRTASSADERKQAYVIVQERLRELNPVIFTSRFGPGAIAGQNVGGLRQYGFGSLRPEELYIQK